MLMADTMAIFFSVLGSMLALIGLWLLCQGLWPEKVARASERGERSFFKPFLVGLPLTAFAITLIIAAANLLGPLGQTLAIAMFCLLMCYIHVGVAGVAHRLGRRLAPAQEAEPLWRTTARGGIVLVLAYLLPIIGWFFILPITFIIGCGLTTLSLRPPRVTAHAHALPDEAAPGMAPDFYLDHSLSSR
ncbi:MAG TPA: hypothetical protein VM870_01865 [Pyrinomonadaceae bacterium]|jgi:hypothetical protein|nr:hypothetical protein [Pyrinomonadaceae bacterium]